MLQIKNTLGGGKPEGLYAWKKSEIIQPEIAYENPQITISIKAGATTATITAQNFDLTKVSDWSTFFEGFKAIETYNTYPNISGNYLRLNSGYSMQIKSFTASSETTGTFSLGSSYASGSAYSSPLSYTGTKVVQSLEANTLGFVVDDDPTAYPDGAAHTDGYYYELLGQVLSANVMSLSDTALATVQQDYRDTVESEVSNANS